MEHANLMDNIYRYQRYIYDFTRKYYLLGRDKLIAEMAVKAGDRVLEIGCGTARNLVYVGRRFPQARLYGLDASREMLNTAEPKLRKAFPGRDIPLRQCLAETLDYQETFGLEEPFDAVFFSYALSMIPPWEPAMEAALRNLKPGGKLYIVDFCDQQDLPAWFRKLLTYWLSLFHVAHKPELLTYLERIHGEGRVEMRLEFLYGRYAFLAYLTKKEA